MERIFFSLAVVILTNPFLIGHLIDQGGVKLDGQKVPDYNKTVNFGSVISSVGTANFARIVVNSGS